MFWNSFSSSNIFQLNYENKMQFMYDLVSEQLIQTLYLSQFVFICKAKIKQTNDWIEKWATFHSWFAFNQKFRNEIEWNCALALQPHMSFFSNKLNRTCWYINKFKYYLQTMVNAWFRILTVVKWKIEDGKQNVKKIQQLNELFSMVIMVWSRRCGSLLLTWGRSHANINRWHPFYTETS